MMVIAAVSTVPMTSEIALLRLLEILKLLIEGLFCLIIGYGLELQISSLQKQEGTVGFATTPPEGYSPTGRFP
jgi:hypothetical protein